ncbi:protein RKD5-like isoform X3 [Tasmannia lanceolata]|uniref:protein RKD5-like isoform X3 n=1 Tax=Tasmannia lanceolata TaxID=3420 RepID=UPI004063F405
MDSSKPPLLTALAVFKNILNEELIRSIHVYRLEDGKEKIVEREFMFSPSSYVEMVAHPLIKFPKYRELFEGKMIGLWLCMLAFDIEVSTISAPIPSILTISRFSQQVVSEPGHGNPKDGNNRSRKISVTLVYLRGQ